MRQAFKLGRLGLQALQVQQRRVDGSGDLGQINHHVGMLQDPIKLAPDICAELLVYLVILHIIEKDCQWNITLAQQRRLLTLKAAQNMSLELPLVMSTM